MRMSGIFIKASSPYSLQSNRKLGRVNKTLINEMLALHEVSIRENKNSKWNVWQKLCVEFSVSDWLPYGKTNCDWYHVNIMGCKYSDRCYGYQCILGVAANWLYRRLQQHKLILAHFKQYFTEVLSRKISTVNFLTRYWRLIFVSRRSSYGIANSVQVLIIFAWCTSWPAGVLKIMFYSQCIVKTATCMRAFWLTTFMGLHNAHV